MTTRYLNLLAGDTAAEHIHAGSSDANWAACVRIDMAFELYDEDEPPNLVATASKQEALDALQAAHERVCQGSELPGAPARGVDAYINVGLLSSGDWTLAVIDTADDAGFLSVRLRGGLSQFHARRAIAAARAYVSGAAWPTPVTTQRNRDARLSA